MGLQKANLFVPFGGGLETDVDDKLLPLGKLLDAENCHPTREGELTKRYGTNVLPTPAATLGPLGTHLGALVELGTPARTLATPTSTVWTTVQTDGAQPVNSDMRAGIGLLLSKLTSNAVNPDVTYGGGFYFVSYIDREKGAGRLHLVAYDATTLHQAASNILDLPGGNTAWQHRVVFAGGKATQVVADNGGRIVYVVMDGTTFAITATSVAAVCNVTGIMGSLDAQARGALVVTVFPDTAGPKVAAIDFNPATLGVTQWGPRSSAGATIPWDAADGGIAIMQDPGGAGKFALITASIGRGQEVQWDMATAGATRNATATHMIDAAPVTTPLLTGHTTSASATGEYLVVYGSGAGVIKSASRVAGVVTLGLTCTNFYLVCSKSWAFNGDGFIIVRNNQFADFTYYVLKIATSLAPAGSQLATVQARMAVRSGNASDGFSAIASPSAGVFTAAINWQLRVDFSGGFNPTPNPDAAGVQLAVLTMPALPTPLGVPREIMGSTLVPGASMSQFDGVTFAEAGFPDVARSPTVVASGVPGGLTPGVVYWYSVVRSYVDAKGNLWRGAPSTPVAQNTGAGTALSLTVFNQGIGGRKNVKNEIYRGAASVATLLQKVAVVANDESAVSSTYVDTLSDADLAQNEFLYTTGGVLSNDATPGFSALVDAGNRTWGISTDDPQVLWPSKEHAVGIGVEFSEAMSMDVRDDHGPMWALSVIDGRPIVFKRDALYVVSGSGFNNLGQGSGWIASLFCQGIGCTNPQAIVETRDGTMFRSTSSRAGFFLIDRGLTVTYIGAPVQRYNSETITGSVFITSLLQARFFTASGRTLVYDLTSKTWTTYTEQPCQTATAWNGVPVFLSTATGHVLLEDQTAAVLTDDGASINMVVGTPWIQVNEYRGYERFYRAQLVGELALGNATLRMDLFKNFEAGALADVTLATTPGVLERELRYSAKFGAVKIQVSDGGSTTGRLSLSGMTIVMAVKAGLKPVAASNRLT